ncbi:YceI family protein [Marinobacter changyiensis]|uniref:YceI family protein n=1 Tax=Marinobacter changyiensis TaxID=2604091 RepID=UPI0012648CF5|nr:YceI family protein [Marinobacter changyiensis]
MKFSTDLLTPATLATVLAMAPITASAEPASYTIDDEHFSISFQVMHLGFANVIGMFTEAEGSFEYDSETNDISAGTVTIQADSVFTNHKRRDNHLRKEDFLYVDEYPEIVFTVGDFEPTSDKTGKLSGNLELRGETRPVTLDVTFNKAAEYPFGHEKFTVGISTETTIKRSEWGITYGLNMVDDDIKLQFELEAIKD